MMQIEVAKAWMLQGFFFVVGASIAAGAVLSLVIILGGLIRHLQQTRDEKHGH